MKELVKGILSANTTDVSGAKHKTETTRGIRYLLCLCAIECSLSFWFSRLNPNLSSEIWKEHLFMPTGWINLRNVLPVFSLAPITDFGFSTCLQGLYQQA
jgi:hypothetical protein